MKRGEDNKMIKSGIKRIWIFSLLILLTAGISCSGFTIGGVVPNDEPMTAPFPPKPATDYGKFIIYHVGQGKLKTLQDQDGKISLIHYHISEFRYEPYALTKSIAQKIYNFKHLCGDGYGCNTLPICSLSPYVRDKEQTIFYKDFADNSICGRYIRPASDHPDAIVVNNNLHFYYVNSPYLISDDSGNEALSCDCQNLGVCTKVDGTWTDFNDTPALDLNQELSTLGKLNCYFKDVMEVKGLPAYDEDWIRIPISQFGYNRLIPLRFRVMGDQFHMQGARVIKLTLYETAAGGVPVPGVDKPVAWSRFGLDYSRMRDPFIGYMAKPNKDYWLLITDWDSKRGIWQAYNYPFMVFVEATPAQPVEYIFDHNSPSPVIEETAYIYRADMRRSRSGNPKLDNGPSFEPDDPSTKIEDKYPDCDGIPDSGDEGDWGIYEICPAEGGNIDDPNALGIKDGNMQYWEVDNKSAIDDGESFHGVKTNIPSMGDEAPSVIQIGDRLWMFISTGAGIFQLTSLDGLKGLEWSLNNIYENRPSILPRQYADGVPGDPDAPVVSSGRYGICDTKAEGDDVQAIPKGKGFPDAICTTFGEDEFLDSYPGIDEQSSNNGTPVINSGPDGIINSWYMPACVSYGEPVYQINSFAYNYFELKTEAPGNPDVYCGDSVAGAKDENAYLLGDDQWATNSIGLNPPEYWRRQNCNPFMMAEQFNACALGGESNAVAIKTGGDSKLQTAEQFLKGDDYFCHQGGVTGICPGKNGRFDNDSTERILRTLKQVTVNDDELCEIRPAGGLEYVRFKYSNSVRLKHNNIVPGSEIVVSFYLAFYKYGSGLYGWPGIGASEILTQGVDYDINYNTGEITMLGNNWLDPIATAGFDPGFFGDPNTRLKDVLIVYYRYQGAQVGVCPGPNGTIDTPNYFYASWKLPDHILGGPVLEFSPTMGASFNGVNRRDLPDLGDTFVGNIAWDSNQMLFVCTTGDCPISPGSDESMDGAWVLDGSLSWYSGGDITSYSWPPNPAFLMRPYIEPHRFDLYGQYDDWLCPIDNQWALCPAENGYFQLYQLWDKVEVKRYEGVDDLLAHYKKYNDPCYVLETIEEQDEFYESSEMVYVQNAYRGVMGDDRVEWNEQTKEYQVTTGTNGVNQSCFAPSDSQLIPRFQGAPYKRIINPGPDGKLDSSALKDELFFEEVENEKPIPKIKAGDDGICNSYRIGDDRAEIFFGTGAPDYACVLAGPNGFANTTAQGNDTQLYLPGEKTGFDAYQVDTPEIVKDGDKLYLYYTGLGWLKAPKSTPPSKGALGSLGECKRPGLDNRWGNMSYKWSSDTQSVDLGRKLLTKSGTLHMGFYASLDDNQGVILAPRIGVAISTVDRITQNPSDWDRVLQPAVDVGGICQAQIAGNLMSIVGGLLGSALGGEDISFPPIFNFYGSFSPDVFIKYNEADDQPIFMMFLNGIQMPKSSAAMGSDIFTHNTGLYKPEIQVGLARSIDGIHFDLANDINPLITSDDLMEGVDWALGGVLGGEKPSFFNPTVFEADNDSYSMIFKTYYGTDIPSDGYTNLHSGLRSKKEWLGFAVRSGAVYGGGLAGLISCKINPEQLADSQNWLRAGTSALLFLPLLGLILFKIWTRKTGKS